MNDSFLRYVDTDRSYLPKALDDAVSSVKEFDSVLPMCLIKDQISASHFGRVRTMFKFACFRIAFIRQIEITQSFKLDHGQFLMIPNGHLPPQERRVICNQPV